MLRRPTTVVSALADAVRSEPGRPLVTMYDDRTGERAELSAATFDNWVCKIANLLTAEWDLEPADLVQVSMPVHWQAMVSQLAVWTAGLTVTLDGEDAVAASIVGPSVPEAPPPGGLGLACSLRPLGQPFSTPPERGWLDFATEVPGQPDLLLLPRKITADDPALRDHERLVTHDDLVERGLATAAAIGLEPGGRLLTDHNPTTDPGIETALLAPLAVGGSVVLLVDSPPARRTTVAQQERTTCEAWTDGQSLMSSSSS